MLLFPLGNGCRAPKKVLVSLFLLMVGMIPERSEGQFCYVCDSSSDAPKCSVTNENHIQACPNSTDYCTKVSDTDSNAVLSRSCISAVKRDCFHKVVGAEKTCYDPKVDGEEKMAEMEKCAGDAGETWTLAKNKICICTGELSNHGHAVTCEEVNSSGGEVPNPTLECYKCEGVKGSNCEQLSGNPDLGKDLPKVKCPDRKFGPTKILKAACFNSRFSGNVVRDCGFLDQAVCRRFIDPNKHCSLWISQLIDAKTQQSKDDLKAKMDNIKTCETTGEAGAPIGIRNWFLKQKRKTTLSEIVPKLEGDATMPLFGPISDVGALGISPGDEAAFAGSYNDCLCDKNLCNSPAGHPSSSGIVIFSMVILASAVLIGGMDILPA